MLGEMAGDLGAQGGEAGRVEAVAVERLPRGLRVGRRQVPQVARRGDGQVNGLAVLRDAAQQQRPSSRPA
jgi:hypothetical protein